MERKEDQTQTGCQIKIQYMLFLFQRYVNLQRNHATCGPLADISCGDVCKRQTVFEDYLCVDRAVQRGQDLIDTLNQAPERDTHCLKVDDGEWQR